MVVVYCIPLWTSCVTKRHDSVFACGMKVVGLGGQCFQTKILGTAPIQEQSGNKDRTKYVSTTQEYSITKCYWVGAVPSQNPTFTQTSQRPHFKPLRKVSANENEQAIRPS